MAIVRDFGAKGDGKTDDTAALSHAVQRGDGHLVFPRGDYLITRPLVVPLDAFGRFGLDGQGGTARLIMAGPGPALHLVGSHKRTALPADFAEGVWHKERCPVVRDLEIVGAHPRADGVRAEGVMQPTFLGLLIRRCRHGIHLATRDRNVLVANCHIYDNSGVGVFLDRVNLHQVNVHGSHISYCRQAGIKVVSSEVRNIQIVGNDVEYNYDDKGEDAADVYFDARNGTIREGTIVGNTIQAKRSAGGANVRFVGVGKGNSGAVGMIAVSGNLIGSQTTALHLVACRGVAVTGNAIYCGYGHAVLAEDSEHLVFGSNSIDHNSDYKGPSTDQVTLRRCRNVTLTGTILQHTREAEADHEASVVIDGCENANVTGCQVLGARRRGVAVRDSAVVRVADCTIRPGEGGAGFRAALGVEGNSRYLMVTNNFLARGGDGPFRLPDGAGVASGNVEL